MLLHDVSLISTIPGELFHSVVIRENVAVNTAQQRDGNLKYGNKQMIRRLANRSISHNPRRSFI